MPNLLMHTVSSTIVLMLLAIICYAITTALIYRSTYKKDSTNQYIKVSLILLTIGGLSHLVLAFINSQILSANGMNFGLNSMSLTISAILSCIFIIGCLFMPILRLGLLVLPLSIISIVFSKLWQSPPVYLSNNSSAMTVHILIAVIAYSLITIATIQAVLYAYQNHNIKKRKEPFLLMALPPLQTMEALFFRLLGIGFICLSLTLVGGILISEELISHHIILAILAWFVFAYVLFQHHRNGMRGGVAVSLTVTGFVLIQLGYFGTKIITESL